MGSGQNGLRFAGSFGPLLGKEIQFIDLRKRNKQTDRMIPPNRPIRRLKIKNQKLNRCDSFLFFSSSIEHIEVLEGYLQEWATLWSDIVKRSSSLEVRSVDGGLATNSSGQCDVSWHDRHSFGVQGAQVDVFEQIVPSASAFNLFKKIFWISASRKMTQ